jgi:hypothetical protein
MRTITLAILFLILTVVPVHALTGEEWLSDCDQDYPYIGICSKILNWTKYYEDAKDCGKDYEGDCRRNYALEGMDENYNSYVGTCIPQGVTHGQKVRILMKWLNEHPERLHEYMYHLYGKILLETYPCTENNTP